MSVLGVWLGAVFYYLAQLVLPAGRAGRHLARAFLRQSLLWRPHHAPTAAYLDYVEGLARLERGEPAEGLKLLRRAHRTLPADPALGLDTGVAMVICGEYHSAAAHLERLVKSHPRSGREPQLWFALAWSQLRCAQPTQALDSVRQAAEMVTLNPQLRLVHLLGTLRLQGRIEPEALRGLLRARPTLLPHVLEYAEQLAGHHPPAAQQLIAALPPDLQARSLRLMALSALNAEDLDVARWALERLQEGWPQDSAGLLLQSKLHLREGRREEAVERARRAVTQTGEQDAAAQEQLAEALLLAGDFEQASPHFLQALALGSPSALAGGLVALHLLEQNRVAEARQVFRTERRGDELGCAYSHCATGMIHLREDELPQAVSLASRAWEEYRGLPAWTRPQPVQRHLHGQLERLTRECLQAAEQSGAEDLAAEARALLQRASAE